MQKVIWECLFILSFNMIITQQCIKCPKKYMDSKANGQIHKRKIRLGVLNGWKALAYEITGGNKMYLEITKSMFQKFENL